MRTVSMLASSFIIICAGLFSLQSKAQIVEEKRLEYTVGRGKKIPIAGRGIINYSTCTIYGAPGLTVKSPPSLGMITSAVHEVPIEASTHGNGGCIGVKAPMARVYYQAGNNPGVDTFDFYLISASGGGIYYQAKINVK